MFGPFAHLLQTAEGFMVRKAISFSGHPYDLMNNNIVGGIFYAAVGGFLRRNGRDLGVLLAFLVHLAAFYVAFLIIPGRSALEMTSDVSFVNPR